MNKPWNGAKAELVAQPRDAFGGRELVDDPDGVYSGGAVHPSTQTHLKWIDSQEPRLRAALATDLAPGVIGQVGWGVLVGVVAAWALWVLNEGWPSWT